MNTPTATYRIQFSPSFGFQAATSVVSYLSDLGISDVYASPIFKAVNGSLHDYDVVDPSRLNPDLGDLSDFEALADELRTHKLPRCGGTRKILAVIERPAIIRQILAPLGLPAVAPSLRAPPDPPDGSAADPPREWSDEQFFDDLPVPDPMLG